MQISDSILTAYEAREIAQALNMDEEKAAAYWFEQTIYETEFSERERRPIYSERVCEIDCYTYLYFDWYAGYYFAVITKETN